MNCLICGLETNQTFNFSFKQRPICEYCENTIVKQSIIDKYNISVRPSHEREKAGIKA